ncbi:MAG TPA: PDR/VanB family oxidoreductase [Trebonia sp.]|nr:PDR/VanB family oxidoreductase [Trebonia sp.]
MRELIRAVSGAAAVRLRVSAADKVADGVLALTLEHPHGWRLPSWNPGAHVDLALGNGITRQYSLCGDRFDAFRYRVAVLREPAGRGGSAYVHDVLRPGDLVGLGGPRNNFDLVPSGRYRFVAGGIGITPILPMIAQADALGADWRLLYGGRSRGSMAFLDELAAYGERVIVRPQDEYGLLDLASVIDDCRPANTRLYCCGPAPLLAAAESLCAGRPPGFLRAERFVAPAGSTGPSRREPFEVELARTGRVVTVDPVVSVLDALARAGAPVLSSCQQGVCGTCEVPVLSGEVDHRDSLLDDDERVAGTCMFVCVSRARGDRLVLDI